MLELWIYLFERPADSVYLFTVYPYSPDLHFSFFGVAGRWLPSLVHTYTFILLTAALKLFLLLPEYQRHCSTDSSDLDQ